MEQNLPVSLEARRRERPYFDAGLIPLDWLVALWVEATKQVGNGYSKATLTIESDNLTPGA